MKLTKAQEAALRKIRDNPGKVVAMQRGLKGWLTINGNTENKLSSLGLIRPTPSGTTRKSPTGRWEWEIEVWDLTDAGREALGIKSERHSTRDGSEFKNALQSRFEGFQIQL